jgi:hypothetical protein
VIQSAQRLASQKKTATARPDMRAWLQMANVA